LNAGGLVIGAPFRYGRAGTRKAASKPGKSGLQAGWLGVDRVLRAPVSDVPRMDLWGFGLFAPRRVRQW
jgi:hypothetical protein